MPNRDNEDYCVNAGASPKYGKAYKSTLKHEYHNKPNNQGRFVYREANDNRHDNQRRYDNHDNHNRDRRARIGLIRVVNDGRHDDQRRYVNHDNHNQNKYANVRMNQTASNGRYDNQKRYDNYDNHNRYDTQNRHGNQNRRDNYNRYDKQGRWEDFQGRRNTQSKQNNASRPEPIQRRNWDPIPAHTWRVVCDSMLGGLSSKLRMCGIDCIHVLFDQGGDDSAKLAMRENRILLTRNKNCEKVRSVLYVFNIQYRSYFNDISRS